MKKAILVLIILSVFVLFKTGYVTIELPEPKAEAKPKPLVESQSNTPTPTPFSGLDSDKLWSLVQNWRIKNNLQPYTKDQRLCDIANKRLAEIPNDWSHNGFYKYIYNYPKNTYFGENLARGYTVEDTTLQDWLFSPEHRKNLNYNFRYSCIETQGTYAVQEFANF